MSRLRRALRAVAVDADLLRRRRELRLLMIGQGVSLLGSAITLVAIPVILRPPLDALVPRLVERRELAAASALYGAVRNAAGSAGRRWPG